MTDRRVRKTREALRSALVSLILEQGFESTTVAQITARADVGRSTFYAHYADKEDLLQGSLEGLKEWIEVRIAQAPPANGHPALAFVAPMLEHAGEQRALFAAMVGRRSGALVQDLFHDMWAGFIAAGWPEGDPLAVHAIAGAFSTTIYWWLGEHPELSAEQIERRFRAVIEPGLVGGVP